MLHNEGFGSVSKSCVGLLRLTTVFGGYVEYSKNHHLTLTYLT